MIKHDDEEYTEIHIRRIAIYTITIFAIRKCFIALHLQKCIWYMAIIAVKSHIICIFYYYLCHIFINTTFDYLFRHSG